MSIKGGSELLLSLELDVQLGLFWTFLLPRFLTLLAFLLLIATSSSSLLSIWIWLGLFNSFLDFFLGGRLLSWSSEDSGSLNELAVSVGGGGIVAVVAGWNVGDNGIEVVVSVWNVGEGVFGEFEVGWIDREGVSRVVFSGCKAGEGGFGDAAFRWIVGYDGIGVVASGSSSLLELQVTSGISPLELLSTREAGRSAKLSERGFWQAGSFSLWQDERGGARTEL